MCTVRFRYTLAIIWISSFRIGRVKTMNEVQTHLAAFRKTLLRSERRRILGVIAFLFLFAFAIAIRILVFGSHMSFWGNCSPGARRSIRSPGAASNR